MTDQGSIPPDLFQKLRQMWMQDIANASRAASIRNASISSGGTFSITGGAFVLKADDGTTLFYLGPVLPTQLDGSAQPGWYVRRADGSVVLAMYDAFPGVGGVLNQALNWYDRQGNVVLSDDTDSGQGLARPWLSGGFAPTRYQDFAVSTTSATFETLWDQKINWQQPRMQVVVRHSMDTAATTGEVRVLVNGNPIGSTVSAAFGVGTSYFGPTAVTADFGSEAVIEVQGRRTSASGALKVQPMTWVGRQS